MSHTLQSAYNGRPGAVEQPFGDPDERVRNAMFRYLTNDLGLDAAFAAERSRMEVERSIPRSAVARLRAAGVELAGALVVEVGGGLGGLSLELAHQGARAVCVEPGEAWRELAGARLRRFGTGCAVGAVGEALPFASGSADVVVSLQVLEHVQQPTQVICEIFRILKPGGIFYLSCENYLAFREQHYKIAWLPLLPKKLGSVYLRARGRSPLFLNEAVTYVTRPGILAALKGAGFRLRSEDEALAKFADPRGIRQPVRRWLGGLIGKAPERLRRNAAAGTVLVRGLFSVGIAEICFKPSRPPGFR